MKHGGDIYTEGVLKGRKLVDFSSNINPTGISKDFINQIEEAIEIMKVYPDIHYRNLKENICRYLSNCEKYFSTGNSTELKDVKSDNIIVGNGASEILNLLISSLKSITIVVPSFIEYKDFSKKNNVNIKYSFLNEDMEYDYKDIFDKIISTEGIIIGNPNNPNGCVIDHNKFKKILDYCEEYNKIVIIDEAFIEFALDYKKSFINYIKDFKCLVVVRAITKFYSMPGIRLGYGVTKNKYLLEHIRINQNPWSINCFAEIAAKYALFDEKFIRESINWISTEREYIFKELKKFEIFRRVYNSKANYLLCELKDMDSNTFCKKMLEMGILIRNCDNYKGLDHRFIRVAIKDRYNNNILLSAIKNL